MWRCELSCDTRLFLLTQGTELNLWVWEALLRSCCLFSVCPRCHCWRSVEHGINPAIIGKVSWKLHARNIFFVSVLKCCSWDRSFAGESLNFQKFYCIPERIWERNRSNDSKFWPNINLFKIKCPKVPFLVSVFKLSPQLFSLLVLLIAEVNM